MLRNIIKSPNFAVDDDCSQLQPVKLSVRFVLWREIHWWTCSFAWIEQVTSAISHMYNVEFYFRRKKGYWAEGKIQLIHMSEIFIIFSIKIRWYYSNMKESVHAHLYYFLLCCNTIVVFMNTSKRKRIIEKMNSSSSSILTLRTATSWLQTLSPPLPLCRSAN